MTLDVYHDKLMSFLETQQLTVVATARDNQPESALIAFVSDEALHVYFQTGADTRKAANLAVNPRVSLVFGLASTDMTTIQYEGVAAKITDPTEIEACKQRFIAKKSPTTLKHLNRPTTTFYKVIPLWIGYSDYTGEKPKIIEIHA